MDISKYPIDKLFYFAAGIIPGVIVLTIFNTAHPNAFAWFFALGFGYKTAAAIILLTSFIIGYTLTTFTNGILGVLGHYYGTKLAQQQPFQAAHLFEAAPWRDRLWRTALKNALGKDTPDDTLLVSEKWYNERKDLLTQFSDPTGSPMFLFQQQQLADLDREKLTSEINDGKWREWYDHYHRIVLEKYGRDFDFHIRSGLNFNLEVAGLYVLLSSFIVPGIRYWWSVIPACVWVFIGIAEIVHALRRYPDKWSTLFQQIDYLSKAGPEPAAVSTKASA
jgi:hypothetical protein